jgi:hypothetical protein
LTSGGKHHQLAATETINDPDGDKRGEEVGDTVEASKQETQVMGNAD